MAAPADFAQAFNDLNVRLANIENDISTLKTIEPSLSFFHRHLKFFEDLVAHLGPRLSSIENTIDTVLPAKITQQAQSDKHEVLNLATRQVQDTLRGELDAIRHSMDGFRSDAHALWATKAEVEHARLANATHPQAHSTKPKIPTPDAFSGKREDWKSFSSRLSLFFTANESQHPKDSDKILYAISRLGDGSAFKYMEQFIPDFKKPAITRPMIISNYETFITTMSENFGVQNAHIIAEAQLRGLKQKGSAMDYTNKFVELASDTDWNDSAKISQYRLGLKDAVQDQMAFAEEPKEFPAFAKLAINLDKRLYARFMEKQNSHSRSTPTTALTNNRTTTTNSRPAPPPTPAPIQPSTYKPPPSMAMDLSQARHLTAEEKQHRRDTNACFYCGDTTHWSGKCTAKKSVLASATKDYSNDDSAITFELGKDSA